MPGERPVNRDQRFHRPTPRCPCYSQKARCLQARVAFNTARMPRPGDRVKPRRSASAGRVGRANSTTARARGCSERRSDCCRQAQRIVIDLRRRSPAACPSVTVPVLSRTMVSTRRSFSSASPPLISRPSPAPRPGGDHHGGRHGQPHRAGTRNNQHRDGGRSGFRRLRRRRSSSRERQRRQRAIRSARKSRLMRSASLSIGARERLRLAHQRDDARQHARFTQAWWRDSGNCRWC